jgi:hypothetical protein
MARDYFRTKGRVVEHELINRNVAENNEVWRLCKAPSGTVYATSLRFEDYRGM